jgi:hypothetical protein
MSYAIGSKELTLTDIKQFKQNCMTAGIARALALGVGSNEGELVVREALPLTDFGLGAVGWTTEEYRTAALGTPGWNSAFSAGAVPANAPTMSRSQVAVFYKFADVEAAPVVTALRFRIGQAGATTKALFNVQLETTANLEPDVYFSEPIIYDPQDVLYIEVYTTAIVAVSEHIPFGAFIIEKIGGIIS